MAFKCSACGATFATEHELMNHNKVHMGGAAPPVHKDVRCAACGATFHSEGELKHHVAQAHQM